MTVSAHTERWFGRRDPDHRGYFGDYGGRFVPETLVAPIESLERAYLEARQDPSFAAELLRLLTQYAGRPTPLWDAQRLRQAGGGVRILLKREDLTHTGAHKINNALGQALLAARMGKKRIVAETPGAMLADQFFNPVNPNVHYMTTGPEIWEQTQGRITHLIASAGTGGTISGAGKFLKEQNPAIKVIAGDPAGSIFASYHKTGVKGEGAPYKVEGIGNDKLPSTLWFDVIDEYRTISDRDAFTFGRRLTREEGLFVGGSAGLIVKVAHDVAHEADDPEALVVCILPDTGERYLSKMYNEEWLRENRLIEPERLTARDMVARKDSHAPPLVTVTRDTSTREALALITEYDISQLPVCDNGECVGSVAESTLMGRIIENPAVLDQPISTFMDAPLPVIEADTPMSGIGRLLTRQTPAVLIRVDGKLNGIVTRFDVVRYLTA